MDQPKSAPDNPQLVDNELFMHALATVAAADRSSIIKTQGNEFVLQFLLGRSMELALKAFLINHGFTERKLRGIGHNLVDAFRAAENEGFRMSGGNEQTRDQWLEVLNENYSTKLFEYPLIRGYRVLNLRLVRNMIERTMWGVAVALWGESYVVAERNKARAQEIGLCEWSQAGYKDTF
jgi:hypothetical protein